MTDTSKWAIFATPNLPRFHDGRVALLGDAAHASTPHQGAGLGQAIEDAHLLAELLSDKSVATTSDAVIALQAYDAVRRPRAQRVVATSTEHADMLCGNHDIFATTDQDKIHQYWQDRFSWLWDVDPSVEAAKARRILAKLRSIHYSTL